MENIKRYKKKDYVEAYVLDKDEHVILSTAPWFDAGYHGTTSPHSVGFGRKGDYVVLCPNGIRKIITKEDFKLFFDVVE